MISSDGHAGLPTERYRDAFDVALPQQLAQPRTTQSSGAGIAGRISWKDTN